MDSFKFPALGKASSHAPVFLIRCLFIDWEVWILWNKSWKFPQIRLASRQNFILNVIRLVWRQNFTLIVIIYNLPKTLPNLGKTACSPLLFTSTFQYFYTDLSAHLRHFVTLLRAWWKWFGWGECWEGNLGLSNTTSSFSLISGFLNFVSLSKERESELCISWTLTGNECGAQILISKSLQLKGVATKQYVQNWKLAPNEKWHSALHAGRMGKGRARGNQINKWPPKLLIKHIWNK